MFQCLVVGYISQLVTWDCVHASLFRSNVTNNSNPTSVYLTCPISSWIHVTSMTYDRPESCTAYPLPGCVTRIDVVTKSVNKKCVGRYKCQTSVQLPQRRWSSFQLNILYDCIEDNRLNICDTITERSFRDTFYLHSPGYPRSRDNPDHCTCDMTGSGITVTAYELNLPYWNSHFEVKGDNRVELPSLVDQIDVGILRNSRTGRVVYLNSKMTDQNVWLEVSHSGNLVVSCGAQISQQIIKGVKLPPNPSVQSREPVFTAPPPIATSPPLTTTEDILEDEPPEQEFSGRISTGAIVTIVVGVVIVSIAVIVVVIFKRRKGGLSNGSAPEVSKSKGSSPGVQKSKGSVPEVQKTAGKCPPPPVPERQDSGSYANPYLELTNDASNVYDELAQQTGSEEHSYSGIKTHTDIYLTPQPAPTPSVS